MIRFINPFTGTETLVADERKDEYLGAGYKLAPEIPLQKPVEPVEEKKEEPTEKLVEKKTEPAKKARSTKKK